MIQQQLCVCVHAHTNICVERSSKTLSIMSESSKKSIMSEKAEVLHMCKMIVQSSKFSVEFISFISMLITNDAFLILLKLLVLSITQR